MKKKADRGFRTLLWAAVVIIGLGLTLFFIFADQERQQLPPEILGKWYSADPRYQACFMDIRPDSFVMGGADGNSSYYGLTAITGKRADNGTGYFYTLSCVDADGLELDFRFYFEAESGLLSYTNQRDIIWFKAKKTPQGP